MAVCLVSKEEKKEEGKEGIEEDRTERRRTKGEGNIKQGNIGCIVVRSELT